MNITCENPKCSSEFKAKPSDNRKYCSRSCAATVNGSKYPKKKRSLGSKRTCRVCLRDSKSRSGLCASCRSMSLVHKEALKIDRWRSGDYSIVTNKSGQLSKWAKTQLVVMSGSKCTECGWGKKNPKLDRPILAVDHIDGNWTNNSFQNLRVLCFNCHTLTETFGSLNIGNSPQPRPGLTKIVASLDVV